jgi:hypothetical protein
VTPKQRIEMLRWKLRTALWLSWDPTNTVEQKLCLLKKMDRLERAIAVHEKRKFS